MEEQWDGQERRRFSRCNYNCPITLEDVKLIREIHQRQNELTIPKLVNIEKTLYDAGGVCETVNIHKEKIRELNLNFQRIPTVVGWVVIAVSTTIGLLFGMYKTFVK